jgi:hypothetical protein
MTPAITAVERVTAGVYLQVFKIVSNWQSLLPIYIFIYLFYTAFRKKIHWANSIGRGAVRVI